MSKLTPKQDAFVKEYIINGGNAVQAAITAGYSDKTAHVIGPENLAKPCIAKAIALHQETLEEEFVITGSTKLQYLHEIMKRGMAEDKMDTVIRAIDQTNKMDGGHVSIKNTHELTEGLTLNMNYGPKKGD